MTMATISRAEEKLQLEDLHQYEEDIAGYCRQTLAVVFGGANFCPNSRPLTRTATSSTSSFFSLAGGGGGGGGSIGGGDRSDSPPMSVVSGGSVRSHHVTGVGMEQEKRIRREIANSNERRRMQSINAGFQSLRTLLPHHEGEKLSKAAILQQTAEYIYQLEQEKTRLLSQNCQLKRLVSQHTAEGEASASKKRKTEDIEVDSVTGATNDLIDVRVQLDRERRLRMLLEDQVRNLESQLYPERIREITQQVQLQYQQREDSSDVFSTSRSHFNQEGSLIISDSHEQDDKGSVLSGGAVITPMRRSSELLSASPETVAAVANLQVVAGGAAIQPVSHTETVIATVTGSPPASPSGNGRITSILEAAIKAEPKVEVERLSPHDDRSTVYVASTSRQNLKTIVEAIRHLEGDNLENLDFSDGGEAVGERGISMSLDIGHHHEDVIDDEDDEEESEDAPPQDAPLALTTSNKSSPSSAIVTAASSPADNHAGTSVKVNMNQYLQFHQQQRPGVIVVKQHT